MSTVDPEASAAAIEVLRDGGNAADAAVAAAATLGVTEPYSAGIGGGGYFVFYNAETGRVGTIDGRETAPAAMPNDAFIDPATGEPYRFTPELVTSGVSVGVPGTPATWERALDRWGTWDLDDALKPAIEVANRGFVVDETFRQQTLDNKLRFAAFTSTSSLFLPGGDAPAVGSVFKNPDLAETYRLLAEKGTRGFYRGPLAEEIAATVQAPPKTEATTLPVPVGHMTTADLAAYRALDQAPTHVEYRGLDVYGMAPSSSGGTTVGEALNILDTFNLSEMSTPGALHHYLEASALAFADRGKYVGDPAFVDVPTDALTDPLFGKERACQIDPKRAATKPVAPGDVSAYDGACPAAAAAPADEKDTENISTTNLTVADKWGNVVEYTLTIEQTGGSGIVVPGRGFLLNNELTDFSTVYDANGPEPDRAGEAPALLDVAHHHPEGRRAVPRPRLARRIDDHHHRPADHPEPGGPGHEHLRGDRGAARVAAEHGQGHGRAGVHRGLRKRLAPYGHVFTPSGDAFTSAAEIGAATAIEFMPDGRMVAAAEPVRRGGGSAMVVKPSKSVTGRSVSPGTLSPSTQLLRVPSCVLSRCIRSAIFPALLTRQSGLEVVDLRREQTQPAGHASAGFQEEDE